MSKLLLAAAALLLSSPLFAQLNENSGNVPPVGTKTIDFTGDGETITTGKPADGVTKPSDADLLSLRCWKRNAAGEAVEIAKARKISADDVEWLAKAIHGETGGKPKEDDAQAMLWTLGQRLCFAKGFRDWSITKMVQNYSQPVNERWTRHGPECGGYSDAQVKAFDSGHKCAAHRFPKRDKYRNLVWKDIAALARQQSVLWAQGKLQNPVPGSVGWFATGTWDKGEAKGYNASSWEKRVKAFEIQQNVFYYSSAKNSDTQKWTGNETTVE